jgi:LysM repeat protein
MRRKLLVFASSLICLPALLLAKPLDSVRVENSAGKRYIIHKVEKGQGLFAIARRYNAEVRKVIEANGEKTTHLSAGDILRIPMQDLVVDYPQHSLKENRLAMAKAPVGNEPKKTVRLIDEVHANAQEVMNERLHTVQAGETLSRIAARYKVTQQLLLRWNGLKTSRLEIGQELIVASSLVVKPYEKWNAPNSVSIAIAPSTRQFQIAELVEQTGLACTSSTDTLTHHEAPVGSLILVTDLDSGRQCYVKVLGNSLSAGEHYVILLSPAIQARLGGQTAIARVSLKYIIN